MNIQIKRSIESDHVSDEDIISLLLRDRDITDKKGFLSPIHPYDIPFTDFFSERSFNRVLKKLEDIREKNEMIVVYTDYDADGITGGAILWETLHLLGYNVMPYVPHRKHEGYGFSKKGIDAVKKQFNPRLIISVDHGISATDKITYAKTLGISIIVTDHHMKSEKSPDDAYAVFHTDKLSGSGVAYFFAKEIYRKSTPILSGSAAFNRGQKSKVILEKNFKKDYVVFATIGTIADLVPLVGASRSIVKHGLTAFLSLDRVGIRHILQEAGIAHKPITPYEIGFIIAPRINAVGRIWHAIDALRLLCTTQDERAFHLAHTVSHINKERQDLVEKALEEAEKKIKNEKLKMKNQKIIFLKSHGWHEGIIGLIASKITEQYYRPTIVATISDGFAKASARSIPGFDITSFLRSHSGYLVDVGGHTAAAGFTMETGQIEPFSRAIIRSADLLLSDKILTRSYIVDMKFPFKRTTLSLIKLIENLSPFGIGNPRPTFYAEGVVRYCSYFGKKKEHVKLYIDDGREVIFFRKSADFLSYSKGQTIGIVYSLEVNRWNSREDIRIKGIAVFPISEKKNKKLDE